MSNLQYLTVNQIAENGRFPFTAAQLRYYLLGRHKNGLNKAVYKLGKRLYLRLDLFEDWIESHSRPGS